MSLLRSFKESLKPCSNFPSNFSQSSSVSQESSNDTLIIPRRPPKSSLAQQLQRLGETYNFSLPQQNPETRREKAPVEKSNVFDDEEKEKEQEQEKFGRHQLGQFQFDHTGPFEPLVLSKDGEFPIIQVSNFYFFFLRKILVIIIQLFSEQIEFLICFDSLRLEYEYLRICLQVYY